MANDINYPTVSPYLTVEGAEEAIAHYQKAFGAKELFRHPAEDGTRLMHATLEINGSIVMLSDDFPEFMGTSAPDKARLSPVCISLRLEKPADVDKVHDQAVAAGGASKMAPENMFWGDRFAMLVDPFGHRWMLVSELAKG